MSISWKKKRALLVIERKSSKHNSMYSLYRSRRPFSSYVHGMSWLNQIPKNTLYTKKENYDLQSDPPSKFQIRSMVFDNYS